MDYSAKGFPLRQNRDGTFDSICPRCFRTVAEGMTRPEMDLAESLHRCDHVIDLREPKTDLVGPQVQ